MAEMTMVSVPVPTPAIELLERSRAGLFAAAMTVHAGERYVACFAAGADRRAAVEAGRVETFPVREADDQLRAAETFVQLVEAGLGLERHPALPVLRPALP